MKLTRYFVKVEKFLFLFNKILVFSLRSNKMKLDVDSII